MKLAKTAGTRSWEARLRQPGPLPVDDSEFDEMGRGLMSSFERLQPKKLGKDNCGDGRRADAEENKYDKLRLQRRLSLLLVLVCLIAVGSLVYPDSNSMVEGDEDPDDGPDNSYDREHNSGMPGCKKTRSSSMRVAMELKHNSGYGNTVTDCDLPKGASLLGLLQLKRHASGGGLNIGLVNIDEEEQQNWNLFTLGWGKYVVFPFEPVSETLQWSDFYPEWIDEDLSPPCPHLPMPTVRTHERILHAVIVKAPCGRRDVGRLQILLAAATVASKTADPELDTMLVLIISECRPLLNLFPCDELLERQEDLWVFQVNLQRIRQRLSLPVGSCELSLHLKNNAAAAGQQGAFLERKQEELTTVHDAKREVYATLLHSTSTYVCGAIVAAQSIKLSGSKRGLVALVDEHITSEQREALQLAGWTLHDIERIRNPKSEPQKYNAWNYSKFRLWQLVQYDKIIYVDADLLVLQNLDFLFDMPELSATGNDKSLFNSGVMVIEPSNCTFNLLMNQIDEIESYNGGDQGFLNEIFPWWHRIPKRTNFLKHFWSNTTKELDEKTILFKASDPPLLHVIHYLGRKPWLCFRDYDCNWNSGEYRRYASDVAHWRWWKVHDAMHPKLQQQCLLGTKQKAHIEFNRRRAEAAAFEDEHWKINVTDPRLRICNQKFCNWESMLKHWGEEPTTLRSRRRLQY